MREHPAFPRAVAQAARGLVSAHDGNRVLNRILNDRGRALFAMMALYLHAQPDAAGVRLTAGRIIALCEETGLCSRGRAKAMLMLMRWAGYVEPSPAATAADRRQKPLVPTPRLMAMQRERWREQYEAIRLVDPRGTAALGAIDDPDFCAALIRALVARFLGGFRVLHHAPPLDLFAHRDGGMMIAFSLMLAGAPGDAFPPHAPVGVPIAALARQFDLSRAHVRKVLRDAEALGLLARADDASGRLLLLPPLREALLDFFATAFLALADGAEAALRTTPRRHAVAPPDLRGPAPGGPQPLTSPP